MLRDLMYRDRVNKDYGITYEDPQTPPPQPQAQTQVERAIPRFELGVEPVQEFLPEEFAPETRKGSDVPVIHRLSNQALRENELRNVRCPNCSCEFSVDAETR